MGVSAVQGANGLPNLMGALLQATMQQSIQLAADQAAMNLSLQVSGVSLDGLGENVDVYA